MRVREGQRGDELKDEEEDSELLKFTELDKFLKIIGKSLFILLTTNRRLSRKGSFRSTSSCQALWNGMPKKGFRGKW